jgi:hypothetical protein
MVGKFWISFKLWPLKKRFNLVKTFKEESSDEDSFTFFPFSECYIFRLIIILPKTKDAETKVIIEASYSVR